ncbi:MAG: NUDIX domain-containing protein [Vulcanimicrobiaceae bacterium]
MRAGKGPAVVVGAILVDDGRILLARFPKWANKWAIPGGKVRYGEALLDALRREVLEETGLIVDSATILRAGESIKDPLFRDGLWHLVFIDFIVTSHHGDVTLDNRELVEYAWVKVREALEMNLTPATADAVTAYLTEQSR